MKLATGHELLEDHVVVELEGGEDGIAQRRRVGCLRDPDGGPQIGGLDEDRQTQRLDRLLHRLHRPRAGDQAPRRDGEAVVPQDRLGDALVHADGGREHTRAHVGQTQRLEVPLQHAVFAEGPVQCREHDRVGRQCVAEVGKFRRGILADEVVGGDECIHVGHVV